VYQVIRISVARISVNQETRYGQRPNTYPLSSLRGGRRPTKQPPPPREIASLWFAMSAYVRRRAGRRLRVGARIHGVGCGCRLGRRTTHVQRFAVRNRNRATRGFGADACRRGAVWDAGRPTSNDSQYATATERRGVSAMGWLQKGRGRGSAPPAPEWRPSDLVDQQDPLAPHARRTE
jgi:hypothetical protein